MSFFRSSWLQRILSSLLLVLLSAGPFNFIEQQENEKKVTVICSTQCIQEFVSVRYYSQTKFKSDVVFNSVLPNFTEIILADYILGKFFDPISRNHFTSPDRGPPSLNNVL